MTKPKFAVGDKVRLGKRASDWMRDKLGRSRTRTIVNDMYDPDHQCTYYELGGRGKSTAGIWMRSFMLVHVTDDLVSQKGRPKIKRQYNRR